ncbi:hypothetical protein KIPB_007921, partial [Kipferlia bialata]
VAGTDGSVPCDSLMTCLMDNAHLAEPLDLRTLCMVAGSPTKDVLGHTIRCFVHLRSSLHAGLRPTMKYLFPCPYSRKELWSNSCVAVLPLPGRNDVAIVFPAQIGTIEEAVTHATYVQWDFPTAGWAIE